VPALPVVPPRPLVPVPALPPPPVSPPSSGTHAGSKTQPVNNDAVITPESRRMVSRNCGTTPLRSRKSQRSLPHFPRSARPLTLTLSPLRGARGPELRGARGPELRGARGPELRGARGPDPDLQLLDVDLLEL